MTGTKDLLLIYDHDCPACRYYCHMIQIKRSIGELKLLDARENSDQIKTISAAGLDIDQGMVLKMGDTLFYGSDAIHMLSLIGSRNGLFNQLNYHLFRNKRMAALLYPILRFFRNLLLKLLGRSKINNLHLENNDRF